jgi:hypothetical protein
MTRNHIVRALLIMAMALTLMSCSRITYNYNISLDFDARPGSRVSVVTLDLREYVHSGYKPPSFAGLDRGGVGNPFSIQTTSGNPLADDLSGSIASSISKKGGTASPVIIEHTVGREQAIEALKSSGGNSLVLLTLREWKNDTAWGIHKMALFYDVDLEVFGKDGTVLAKTTAKGGDDISISVWGLNQKKIDKYVSDIATKRLEALFNNPDIKGALMR